MKRRGTLTVVLLAGAAALVAVRQHGQCRSSRVNDAHFRRAQQPGNVQIHRCSAKVNQARRADCHPGRHLPRQQPALQRREHATRGQAVFQVHCDRRSQEVRARHLPMRRDRKALQRHPRDQRPVQGRRSRGSSDRRHRRLRGCLWQLHLRRAQEDRGRHRPFRHGLTSGTAANM